MDLQALKGIQGVGEAFPLAEEYKNTQ